MSKFANLVISAAQYGLAAGAAAQGTKGAAKGASAAGLFFMLLGLSFFLCMDYNSRFGGLGSGLGPGTIIKFLVASVILTATGFVPYVVISQKSKKFQKAAGGISVAMYIVFSMILGLVLGRNTVGAAQSVILTNMYVLLGSILGMNAREAKGNKSAMANAIMSAVGFVLLTLFDFLAPVKPEAAAAETSAANAANAAPSPVEPETSALEEAAKKATKALENAREAAGGAPTQEQSAALNRLNANAKAAQNELTKARQA